MHFENKNGWLVAAIFLLFGHMAQADIPPGYSVLETIHYEYDADSNRVIRGATVTGVTETPIEAQYNTGNRLTQLTLKGQGQNNTDITCTLAYDPSGNITTKTCTAPVAENITQYSWDSRNRLKRILSQGVDATFKYDALDRRIERTVNGDVTQYLYDGDQAIAELQNGAVSVSILTGLKIDEVIARYTSQGERTLLTDALGSVLIAAKGDATVVTAYGYSPYGETQVLGEDEQNSIQYTAREKDSTGLYYYRARYYDPQIKRFISEDPIGIAGGGNFYRYVRNNPLKLIDPDGLLYIDPDGEIPDDISGPIPGHNDDPCGCFARFVGYDTVAEAGAVMAGQPTVPKRFVTEGSSGATSPISKAMSEAFPQRLPIRVPAPTLKHPGAMSNKVGRIAGRWTPIIGAGMLIYDFVEYAKCVEECNDDECGEK